MSSVSDIKPWWNHNVLLGNIQNLTHHFTRMPASAVSESDMNKSTLIHCILFIWISVGCYRCSSDSPWEPHKTLKPPFNNATCWIFSVYCHYNSCNDELLMIHKKKGSQMMIVKTFQYPKVFLDDFRVISTVLIFFLFFFPLLALGELLIFYKHWTLSITGSSPQVAML